MATPKKLLVAFCFIHLVLWTLLPVLSAGNPPTDVLEGLMWGKMWLWGYPRHPFLAPWLTAGVYKLFGNAEWSLYWIGQMSVVIGFAGVWRFARKFLSPWQALIAVMSLEGAHYYTFSAATFDPNTLMLAIWPWLTVIFYEAVLEQKLYQWLLVGLLAGLSLLSKYESGILLLLLFFTLFHSIGRRSFRHVGLYGAFLLMLIVIAPNLYYLHTHHFNSISFVVNEAKIPADFFMRIYRPIAFLMKQIGVVFPMLLLMFLPFYSLRTLKSFSCRWKNNLLLLVSLGPITLTVIGAIIFNCHLVSRWGSPFFPFLGVAIMVWLNPMITPQAIKKFMVMIIAFVCVLSLGFYGFTRYKPLMTHEVTSAVFPGKALTKALLDQWHSRYGDSPTHIVGGFRSVVNIAAFDDQPIIPVFEEDNTLHPWLDPEQLQKQGGIFIYELGHPWSEGFIQQMKQHYPHINEEFVLTIPLENAPTLPPMKFWVGFMRVYGVKS